VKLAFFREKNAHYRVFVKSVIFREV